MLGRSRGWDLDIFLPKAAVNPDFEWPSGNDMLLSRQKDAAADRSFLRQWPTCRSDHLCQPLARSTSGNARDASSKVGTGEPSATVRGAREIRHISCPAHGGPLLQAMVDKVLSELAASSPVG
jgi:hypothetical protein